MTLTSVVTAHNEILMNLYIKFLVTNLKIIVSKFNDFTP
jgi:agmatine/peptidylarginine deiminase